MVLVLHNSIGLLWCCQNWCLLILKETKYARGLVMEFVVPAHTGKLRIFFQEIACHAVLGFA